MKRLAIAIAVLAATWAPAGPAKGPPLRVHLAGAVTAQEPTLRLGTVCVVVCEDEGLCRQASQVPMGRAPLPGENLVVDRATILARLASSGIPAGRVILSGAPAVTVSRNEQVYTAQQVLSVAEEFLASKHPGPPGCGWRLVRAPGQLVVPRGDNLTLQARLVEDQSLALLRVEVAASEAGVSVGSATADFKLSYPARRAVASADILPGQPLSDQNVRLEDVMSDQPADANWTSPVGLIATAAIPAGAAIAPGMVGRSLPEIMIRRNEPVIMRIEGLSFVLSAPAICLQDGRCSDVVRVRNLDTGRVVSAQVMPDGTVRPLFEEARR